MVPMASVQTSFQGRAGPEVRRDATELTVHGDTTMPLQTNTQEQHESTGMCWEGEDRSISF